MSEAPASQTTTGGGWRRIMLKVSGEALMGDQGYGIHAPTVERIATEMGFPLLLPGSKKPLRITWACSPRS